jgi:pimeloyl-ACP methyl ester carboxylesterase
LVVPSVGGYYIVESHFLWAEQTYADCPKAPPGYPEIRCTEDNGKLLTPGNLTRYVAWSGCKHGFKDNDTLTACAAPCISTELLTEIDDYNKAQPFELVEFSSRKAPDGQKTAKLKAWWLPSGYDNAPRVVLQHGNNANANSRHMVWAAYLLRSIGIDVLIHSLRSHGLSEEISESCTWSYEYPYDTLGAWDYAVHDPQGILGGPRPPSQVGLMGYSMGAYLVTSALGIEKEVPAIWADSGVWTVDGFTKATLAEYLGPISIALAPITVAFSKLWAGVDITKNSPPELLPLGPDTKRKVAVVASTLDDFVPAAESMQLADFVEKNPTKYNY